ncbi:hypothetical protein [Paenibacillus sp. yr247]|uniref:hypothetical protein n=1 Tax=Paenibacillus sp. yr247 TaxID=1761880 RepID=UPI0020C8DBCF|nr:hypothetical protein [Paenibacillus sp. yr247]
MIGVGSIRTADEARDAMQMGLPIIAIGRELIFPFRASFGISAFRQLSDGGLFQATRSAMQYQL